MQKIGLHCDAIRPDVKSPQIVKGTTFKIGETVHHNPLFIYIGNTVAPKIVIVDGEVIKWTDDCEGYLATPIIGANRYRGKRMDWSLARPKLVPEGRGVFGEIWGRY